MGEEQQLTFKGGVTFKKRFSAEGRKGARDSYKGDPHGLKQQEVLGGWELRRGSGLRMSKATGDLGESPVSQRCRGTEVRTHKVKIELGEWKL